MVNTIQPRLIMCVILEHGGFNPTRNTENFRARSIEVAEIMDVDTLQGFEKY